MEMTPQFFRELLDEIQDGVYFVDVERRITYWNRAAEAITGYRAKEVVGHRCADNILMHVDDRGTCLCKDGCPLAACMLDEKKRAARIYLHHKDGHRLPVIVGASPVRDRHGRVIGAVETFRSDAERLSDLERIKELEHLAYLDELTGVANRRFLGESLHARLAEVRRSDTRFGLIMIDVDHFKQFNDRHGHATGDMVLKMVAATLSANSRAFDLVARYGGEEFVVIVASPARGELSRTAERLRMLVSQSGLKTAGSVLRVTISMGATMVLPDDDEQGLINRADALLYRAKSAGRNRVACDDGAVEDDVSGDRPLPLATA